MTTPGAAAKGALLASAYAAAGLLLLAGVLALSSPSRPLLLAPPAADSTPAATAPARALQASSLLPSLYLNYQDLPAGQKKSWFSTVDVHESGLASFFAVQRTQFGYLGIQQTHTFAGNLGNLFGTRMSEAAGDEWYGLVIFSAWNTAGSDCFVEAIGEGFYQDRFTGEGTGCQIKGSVDWGADQYDFVTTTETMPNGRLKLTGYWEDRHDGTDWLLVGAISVLPQGRQFGEGGLASFIEQYQFSADINAARVAHYGPQFVEMGLGGWQAINTATFDTTETNKDAYYMAGATADSSMFTMAVMGTAMDANRLDTPDGTMIRLRNPGEPSMSAALQGFIQARDQGTLPQGCTGVRTCGVNPLSGVPSLMPSNLLQGLLWVLLLMFCGSAIFTLLFCCRPGGDSGAYSQPLGSPSRSLVRFMP